MACALGDMVPSVCGLHIYVEGKFGTGAIFKTARYYNR